MLPGMAVVQALLLSIAPAAPSSTFTGSKFPPPGSPQDQALLKSMLVTHAALLDGRMVAIRTMKRLHEDGVMDRLTRAAAAMPDAGARVGELRDRLQRAWDSDRDIITRPWPVDPRIGCRAEGIELEVLMADAAKPEKVRRAEAARDSARRCLERQTSVQRPLEAANLALLAADAEARAALAQLASAVPAAARQAKPSATAGVSGGAR